MNLAGLLQRSANTFGERPALHVGTDLWCDYRTLHERVARMAGWLRQDLSLDRGDRVALILRNCPEYVELLLACWHAGLTAVPINAKLHPREIHYILFKVVPAHGSRIQKWNRTSPRQQWGFRILWR